MKKILTFILLFLLSFSSYSLSAIVKEVEGNVQKISPQGKVLETLQSGSCLYRGDTVQLGFKSHAVVAMSNGTIFHLSSMSRIVIEQMTEDEKQSDTQIFLDIGSLKAKVNKTKDRRNHFRVSSAVAVASVRGTEFLFTHKGELYVFEGTVYKSRPDHRKAVIKYNNEPNPPKLEGTKGFDVMQGQYSAEGFDRKPPVNFKNSEPPKDEFIRDKFINGEKNYQNDFKPDFKPNDGDKAPPPPPRGDRLDMAPPSKDKNGNTPPPKK